MDTKATNAFAYLSIFIAFLTTLYYLVFISLLESVEVGKIISFYVGHFVEALVCQVRLGFPTTYEEDVSKSKKELKMCVNTSIITRTFMRHFLYPHSSYV